MGILSKILGDPNEKTIKSLQPIIDNINSLEEKYSKFSVEELKKATAEFKEKIQADDKIAGWLDNEKKSLLQKKLDEILPDAYAVMREASSRVLGQRHYDVQLVGGIILHRGQIAEMKTGEGKTLVATLPLYLNSLAGRGVQLVTVNDYLSQIGAGWMAPLYYFLGLTTGVIIHDKALVYDPEYIDESQFDERMKHFKPVTRKEAYEADILYGTNNEFGFDYLRDNMVPELGKMVQRELYYTIVDEIDSILIDEARTPLIISAPAEESTDRYGKFAELVTRLKENEDYNIDEKMRAVTLTEGGIQRMEGFLGIENIYTTGGIREVHHIEQALKAHALFKRDKEYVVKDGEIVIVDEFTGRLMPGRRYSEGLHQAIEAKENVKVQRESMTLATITFQNYFRMYTKLSGMTGTAVTEAEEFSKIYQLETVVIPTHRPIQRLDKNDLIYKTEMGKFMAVAKEAKRRSDLNQPVLVGTISIEKNEMLANLMEREGLRPQVLNAKNHTKEARFIAEAGHPGVITIATNMAGRGVDIMLGGKEPSFAEDSEGAALNEEKESQEHIEWKERRQKVLDAGGLHVMGTERHESRRIDNQLRGRAGRQGDPGSSQFYVSMDDDLMRIFGGDRMKNIMTTLKVPEDMPIENKIISNSIEKAQTRVEGNNFDIRKHLVEYDDVLNKHRESVYKRRREALEAAEGTGNVKRSLTEIILEMTETEIEQVVTFHTGAEYVRDWNIQEIYEVVATIFPVEKNLKDDLSKYKENTKLDKAKARTQIIEKLVKMANDSYQSIKDQAVSVSLNWTEIEKSIFVRSIDTLWIEHLEAMSSLRQGIGLRGYGQRDPLLEYKKEGYGMFNELNNLIQKEVVYSIFKLATVNIPASAEFKAPSLMDMATSFSAPAKEMTKGSQSFASFKPSAQDKETQNRDGDLVKTKARDEEGNKVGRNDPCPCGSGKKYKKCHGA